MSASLSRIHLESACPTSPWDALMSDMEMWRHDQWCPLWDSCGKMTWAVDSKAAGTMGTREAELRPQLWYSHYTASGDQWRLWLLGFTLGLSICPGLQPRVYLCPFCLMSVCPDGSLGKSQMQHEDHRAQQNPLQWASPPGPAVSFRSCAGLSPEFSQPALRSYSPS